MREPQVLYIFLDESGNLDFSNSGTENYVLAAVTAIQPLASSTRLQQLKYTLLAQQHEDVEHFHASEDKQNVRNQVFDAIKNLSNIKINYIHAKKRLAHPSYHDTAIFYALLGKTLLKYLFNGERARDYEKIVVIFDKALNAKEQKQFLKVVKPELKAIGKPYAIYFHRTLSDFNGQIADYAAWAKYVSLERGEMRPLAELDNIPHEEFDIFQRGTHEYY